MEYVLQVLAGLLVAVAVLSVPGTIVVLRVSRARARAYQAARRAEYLEEAQRKGRQLRFWGR